MADVVYHEPDRGGSGAVLGVILGVLLVLLLLFGAWWLFFRQPVVVDEPNTTIIEEEQPATQPDVNIQEAPEGDTNIEVPGGAGETSPAP